MRDANAAADIAADMITRARAQGWRGADPYDALYWEGWPRWLVRRARGRQGLIQLHARLPFDVRGVYRDDHPLIAKALALFGAAATRLAVATGDDRHADSARDALSRLSADRRADARAWGYPFAVQTRWSFYPAHTPNVIATSFAALALAEGADALGEGDWRERAEEGAAWIAERLWDEAGGHFVYHPLSRALIHNANLLAARTVWSLGDTRARANAARALGRTLAAQAPDGSFPYGEGGNLGWIDSFHTGYVLEALSELAAADDGAAAAARRGAEYWIAHFIGPRGEAYLFPDRRFPEDGHSAGTALYMLRALGRAGILDTGETASRVARRVAEVVVRDGHAIHRRWRAGRSFVVYPRWCDGHVALGLASHAG